MKKYRIRKVTLNNGTETFYPEQRNVGTFLERHLENWYPIAKAGDREYRATQCNTLKDAQDVIDLYKRTLNDNKIKEVEYIDS